MMVSVRLYSALRRADTLLTQSAEKLALLRLGDAAEFHGLFISDQEFENLIRRPFGENPIPTSPTPADESPPASSSDRWSRLVAVFGLDIIDADILLLCLLPEVDLKYERIYGYLQDDVTCKRPTVDLLLDLLYPALEERFDGRERFEADSQMVIHGLVQLIAPEDGSTSLLRRTVHVAPDVVRYLFADPTASPPPCHPYWRAESAPIVAALYPRDVQPLVHWLVSEASAPLWVQTHAQRAWSTEAVASDLATYRGRPLLQLHLGQPGGPSIATLIRNRVREALLYDAVLMVTLPQETGDPATQALTDGWSAQLEHPDLTVVWHVPAHCSAPIPKTDRVRVSTLELPSPDYEARLALWQKALAGRELAADADLPALAARYRLDGQQIRDAATSAGQRSWQRHAQRPVTFAALTAASREVSAVRLGDLASQITVRHRWEDLILPSDRLAQIQEMCDQYRYRHIVYGTWGFGRQSSRGQGLSALFAGLSGTGKTMAAEVIAHDLALDLFKIDLSGVVSKYIGETEKNLDRIFDLARDSNAILLFDEADALFGKRSETKDAHDRYANIEISYLLQKVEEYDGVVILTSNLRQNLDEAFMRRLQFSIEFPFPDEGARRLIWERTVPTELPLAGDVAFGDLAARFRLSGGSIRNALVSAAFLAARDVEIVSMRHLLWGIRREFQKLGKLIDEGDFVAHVPEPEPAITQGSSHGRPTQ